MRQFNSNYMLMPQLRKMIVDSGIKLPPPVNTRDKVMGFMGDRGTYTVGDCQIATYGHYSDENDDSNYSLKMYKGKDAYWHLFADDIGGVWFSPKGCFHCNVGDLTDLERTPFTL